MPSLFQVYTDQDDTEYLRGIPPPRLHGCGQQFFSVEDAGWKEHRVSHSITSLQTHEQSLVMNIGNIIANLARYRKPAVADNDKARFLAATDNEVAKHVNTCEHFGV